MDLVYINAYTKFHHDSSICSENIVEKHILHQSRAITQLFINKFSPFAIPKPLLPDINVHAKIEENRSISTHVSVRKRSADGRTLRRFGGYSIIPRHFFVASIKILNLRDFHQGQSMTLTFGTHKASCTHLVDYI